MTKISYHILRVGMAITFIWIGVLIIKSPESWAGYMQPWAVKLLPVPIEQALLGTAVLDIIVGLLLLIDWYAWVGGIIGTLHLISVLVVSGISDITIRDIGLLTATIALAIEALPFSIKSRLLRKTNNL